MNVLNKIIIFFIILFLYSCANYQTDKPSQKEEKRYYTSTGFALIFDDTFYDQGIINKKINNDLIAVMHSSLKRNTPIEIINPDSSNMLVAKVTKNANYPKIFNVVISKKIATILDIDYDNPYIEIKEIKKNKTFIAKETDMFEEEKNVAEKAPVKKVKIDDLNKVKLNVKKNNKLKKNNFTIIISDFYYLDSAKNLKQKLSNQTNIKNFSVKKINDNKYRLSVGPFDNFNALKSTYISLNKLGFESLNIYRELQ